jgi:F0F1-type ATP synthase assembly protein I
MKAPEPARPNAWVRIGELTAVAWDFLGSIIAGALLGYFADRHFDISPWGLIACTLLGSCTGLYRMVRTLRRLERRSNG